MIGYSEFYLTDGTVRINLLEANYRGMGIGIEKVRFSRPQKDTESIFSKRYKTIQETYGIRIVGITQDSAIGVLRDLEAILLQADNYFNTTVEMNPVWLVSRAYKESNRRYALIMGGQIPEYADIYQQPFISKTGVCVMDELDLQITRSAWMANPPTTPKDITATNLANGIITGQTGGFYVGNNFTEEPIVSIKHFKAVGSVYTTISPIPFPAGVNALPSPPAAGDILYIGFTPKVFGTSAMPNALYVGGLISGGNITTKVWEFWNGAAWVAVPDIVDDWGMIGSGTVLWNYDGTNMDTWTNSTINGVNATWLRFRVTAVGASPTAPKINALFTLRNFIQVSGIKGDIPALFDIRLESHQQRMASPDITYEIYMGMRATERGATFNPWLPPLNVGVTPVTQSYKYITTGLQLDYQPTTSWASPVKFNTWGRNVGAGISKTADYYGQFRAFLRVGFTGTATDIIMRLAMRDENAYASGTPMWYGKEVYVKAWGGVPSPQPSLYDMGVVTIGGRDRATLAERGGYITLYLQVKSDTATVDTIHVMDLMLLPIDEWSCHVVDTDPTTVGLWYNSIGSASFFKQQIRGINYDPSNQTQILRSLIVEASGPAILPPGKTERIYFLVGNRLSTGQLICHYETAHQVYMKTQEQFLSLRGNG